jgi:hypothetical protein
MGRIVIAAYHPKRGKEEQLLELIHEHLPILKSQGMVTDRKPVVMKAANGTILQIFEWISAKAIDDAHSNPVVQDLWNRFNEVCDYATPVNIKEFHDLFPAFEPIN